MTVTFTTDGDDDLATVEADAFPGIGEMVSIKQDAPSGIALEYRVTDVLWRVAHYPTGTKMSAFVFVEYQKPTNKHEWLKLFLGKTERFARRIARASGYDFRITGCDGERYVVTADYNSDRINVYIENDRITEVNFG
jgi:hypothetical protein